MRWREFFNNKGNLVEFAATLAFITAALFIYSDFLDFNESRGGVTLSDPFLDKLPVINLTWIIFTFIYFPLLLAIIRFSIQPEKIMMALQAYGIMVLFRIAAMYSLPLNPPEGMIILRDPFVEFFGPSRIMVRDLFFSGHTATLFLIYLISAKNWTKLFYLGSTIIVAASLLFQHVHYTIDVLAAPFFAFAAYYIARSIREKVVIALKEG
jgi:hypothetical protein